jgi:hypothetical protein
MIRSVSATTAGSGEAAAAGPRSEMSEKAIDPLVVALPDVTCPNANETRRNEIPTVLSPTHLVDDCFIGRFSPPFSDV